MGKGSVFRDLLWGRSLRIFNKVKPLNRTLLLVVTISGKHAPARRVCTRCFFKSASLLGWMMKLMDGTELALTPRHLFSQLLPVFSLAAQHRMDKGLIRRIFVYVQRVAREECFQSQPSSRRTRIPYAGERIL